MNTTNLKALKIKKNITSISFAVGCADWNK